MHSLARSPAASYAPDISQRCRRSERRFADASATSDKRACTDLSRCRREYIRGPRCRACGNPPCGPLAKTLARAVGFSMTVNSTLRDSSSVLKLIGWLFTTAAAVGALWFSHEANDINRSNGAAELLIQGVPTSTPQTRNHKPGYLVSVTVRNLGGGTAHNVVFGMAKPSVVAPAIEREEACPQKHAYTGDSAVFTIGKGESLSSTAQIWVPVSALPRYRKPEQVLMLYDSWQNSGEKGPAGRCHELLPPQS